MTKATEKALDEIYGGPAADFIKGRDALAKRLRADGDHDAAGAVKSLRKPSRAAAVVNALALDDPKPLKRYLKLADELRKATSGKVDATRMRALAREDGERLEELVARAGELGDGSSASTLDRVRETLQAAQVDAELAKKVVSGRVEREERAASVGLDNLAGPPVAAPRTKSAKAEPAKERKREDAARTRRAAAQADLEDAEAASRQAERDLARAETALAKAERARDAAAGKVERAAKKLAALD